MKMHLQTEVASEFSYHNGDVEEKLHISAEAEMLYYELITALEEEEQVLVVKITHYVN